MDRIDDGAPDGGDAVPAEDRPSFSVLFSGLMVDRPGTAAERFPPAKVPSVAAAIANALDAVDASRDGLAISSGACGGDLLFATAALERSMSLQLVLPFGIERFLDKSVAFAGAEWVARFTTTVDDEHCDLVVLDELGPIPEGSNAFERVNTWMLESWVRARAADRTLILLWDAEPGAGPGGTADVYARAAADAAKISVIDPRQLSGGDGP